MSGNLEEEEVQAILDTMKPGDRGDGPASVEPRDFRQPRRLSGERLQHLSKLVVATLQSVGSDISGLLREYHGISVSTVSEVDAAKLFDDYEAPFVVYCFDCAGQYSWVIWESTAAAAATEKILSGTSEEDADPRRLSRSECRVVEQLLARILRPVVTALDLDVGAGHVAQEPEQLTSLDGAGPNADTRRVLVHLVFEGPGGTSDLRIYLPDVLGEKAEPRAAGAPQTSLPDHLDVVTLNLSAFLGSVDVPLTDLLQLEVGDVIPLGVEVNRPLELYVEDRACAKAEWGKHNGFVAVKVRELDIHANEIDHPTEESDSATD